MTSYNNKITLYKFFFIFCIHYFNKVKPCCPLKDVFWQASYQDPKTITIFFLNWCKNLFSFPQKLNKICPKQMYFFRISKTFNFFPKLLTFLVRNRVTKNSRFWSNPTPLSVHQTSSQMGFTYRRKYEDQGQPESFHG